MVPAGRRIFVLGSGFINSADLLTGMKLFPSDPTSSIVVDYIEHVDKYCTVYNYHCEPFNNFFIGKNSVLTHNSGYSDNDLDFLYLYNQLLEYGTLTGVKIKRMLARLMKPEILQVGNYLGVPYKFTWSCDRGEKSPCGGCGCCTTRRHAFKVAGLKDEQEYLNSLTDNYVSVEPRKYDIKKLLSLLE